MSLNWGSGIVMTCIAFIIFMSSLVYRATQENVDFVTENYYDKELQFQDQIDRERNSFALVENVKAGFSANENSIVIKYPSELRHDDISGELLFYRADDARKDFKIPVKSDPNHRQIIDASGLKRGMWNIKFSWTANDINYYSEQRIFLN